MEATTRPYQPWADIQSAALAWHDRGRKEWVGHAVRLGDASMIVDRVENRGDGVWRLYLIPMIEAEPQSTPK